MVSEILRLFHTKVPALDKIMAQFYQAKVPCGFKIYLRTSLAISPRSSEAPPCKIWGNTLYTKRLLNSCIRLTPTMSISVETILLLLEYF